MANTKKLKITFLGTGTSTGVPMVASNHPVRLSTDPKDKRLRSSIMVSWDVYNYVIDTTPDFRQQMLREDVQSINGILFTTNTQTILRGLMIFEGFILGKVKFRFIQVSEF